ncbi:MAG: VTT domain-containing protein [Bacteroidales bacterium]|nr:VTT domain-containing protein [Bacteroidales bacterium]
MSLNEKTNFLIRNLINGLIWLVIILGLFFIFKNVNDKQYLEFLAPIYEHPTLILLIYSFSELIFGIIPPEIFMIWALTRGGITVYIYYISLFAILSYLAGFIGFLFGMYLKKTNFYKMIKTRYLSKYEYYLKKYGLYLIIVAALTPLPFSGISILIGSVNYPLKKYLFYALFRFVRFAVYSFLIWEARWI